MLGSGIVYMDNYVRKIITASRNHLKPRQGGTTRKKGYNGRYYARYYVEDMISMIPGPDQLIYSGQAKIWTGLQLTDVL